jgi:ubiquitin-conjugating enzyme E2 variant
MVDMPRTFRLYEELEKGEKGQLADNSISYGLDNPNDQTFSSWNATILGPANTKFDNRIYFLSITTGEKYPAVAPTVKFNSKINIPSVEQTNGNVTGKFPLFAKWSPSYTMETILCELKKEMIANKGAAQPADGTMF